MAFIPIPRAFLGAIVRAIGLLLSSPLRAFTHPYSLRIGYRYLRSKKRKTVSVISFIAVAGVALGVASLLSVISITSGFQQEFRDKVLGVNAHVLVLKYGLDFSEYRGVLRTAEEMPEVAGAAPFVIQEMMLAHGDRVSGVLVKGVDPERMPTVLDLPAQMVQGSLDGLRRDGAGPPVTPDDLVRPPDPGEGESLDEYLLRLAEQTASDAGAALPAPGRDAGVADPFEDPSADPFALLGADAGASEAGADAGVALGAPGRDAGPVVLPEVEVPSVEAAEAALADMETNEDLPEDDIEDQIFAEEEAELEGTDEDLAELPGIVLGAALAANLGVGVGHRVTITSPLAGLDTSMLENGPTPRSRSYRVIGLFEAGFQEYDSHLVYVDLFEAQTFLGQGDSVTGVEIRLHDLERAPELSRRLERALGGGPYHTMDWQELNHNLFTALEIQKFMLSFVYTTIVVVAAFVVIATLIMVVLEKKREIAILRAMGAQRLDILYIFLVQGVMIGSLGTAIGLLLGGGICAYLEKIEFPLDPRVYLIDHLPVRADPVDFVMTVIIAFLICAIATLIPSWWASRMLPADGVRYE